MAKSIKSNGPSDIQAELLVAKAPGAGGGGGGGSGGGGGGGGAGGNGGGGGGGGRPPKADLYGDQYVLLRDLDPTDGGGDGEPLLDDNGNPILIGTDGRLIYYVVGEEEDYEISSADLPYVQTVELERANVARAPDKVMEKSLLAALTKIDAADVVSTDTAGRIVCDGVTIDSPLENLALYQYLMTAGGQSSWPEVTNYWTTVNVAGTEYDIAFLKDLLGDDVTNPDWHPGSLLGAAFSKFEPITMDAVLYENSVLGVNGVSTVNGETVTDYFDFSDGSGETYNYSRADHFAGVEIQWFEDTDGDPSTLELVSGTVMDVVFGGDDGSGDDWVDEYMGASAELGGVNDFAQAAEDARAVIYFMHEHYGAVEVPVELVGVSATTNGMFAADCQLA